MLVCSFPSIWYKRWWSFEKNITNDWFLPLHWVLVEQDGRYWLEIIRESCQGVNDSILNHFRSSKILRQRCLGSHSRRRTQWNSFTWKLRSHGWCAQQYQNCNGKWGCCWWRCYLLETERASWKLWRGWPIRCSYFSQSSQTTKNETHETCSFWEKTFIWQKLGRIWS